jgi:hypothetical protein
VTLLILEVKVPHLGAGEKHGSALAALWPSYVAFGLSFFVILVTWIAHHDLMRLVRGTNIPLQIANGAALAYVTFIPFPTRCSRKAWAARTLHGGRALLRDVRLRQHRVQRPGRGDRAQSPGAERRRSHGDRAHPEGLSHHARGLHRGHLIALVQPYLALVINVAVRLHLLRVHHADGIAAPTGVGEGLGVEPDGLGGPERAGRTGSA